MTEQPASYWTRRERCRVHDCTEPRANDMWCAAHIASRPADVERAVEWLAENGYEVEGS